MTEERSQKAAVSRLYSNFERFFDCCILSAQEGKKSQGWSGGKEGELNLLRGTAWTLFLLLQKKVVSPAEGIVDRFHLLLCCCIILYQYQSIASEENEKDTSAPRRRTRRTSTMALAEEGDRVGADAGGATGEEEHGMDRRSSRTSQRRGRGEQEPEKAPVQNDIEDLEKSGEAFLTRICKEMRGGEKPTRQRFNNILLPFFQTLCSNNIVRCHRFQDKAVAAMATHPFAVILDAFDSDSPHLQHNCAAINSEYNLLVEEGSAQDYRSFLPPQCHRAVGEEIGGEVKEQRNAFAGSEGQTNTVMEEARGEVNITDATSRNSGMHASTSSGAEETSTANTAAPSQGRNMTANTNTSAEELPTPLGKDTNYLSLYVYLSNHLCLSFHLSVCLFLDGLHCTSFPGAFLTLRLCTDLSSLLLNW